MEVDPWDMYEAYVLECNPVPAVAGHTVQLIDAPDITPKGDVNVDDLGDSDGEEPPILHNSSEEEDVPIRRKPRQYRRHRKRGDSSASSGSSSDDVSVRASRPVPSMPTVRERNHRHRDKCSKERLFHWNAVVARPVGKAEIARVPEAKKAMDKEWNRLRDKRVWIEEKPREWDEVRAEAKKNGHDVHMGYLFGICVQKNSELPDNDDRKKYTCRVVFQGNRVVDHNFEAAIFQDLGSSPSTMEAAKIADFFGSAPGNVLETADAEQAHIQAEMKGTPTWILLSSASKPEILGYL